MICTFVYSISVAKTGVFMTWFAPAGVIHTQLTFLFWVQGHRKSVYTIPITQQIIPSLPDPRAKSISTFLNINFCVSFEWQRHLPHGDLAPSRGLSLSLSWIGFDLGHPCPNKHCRHPQTQIIIFAVFIQILLRVLWLHACIFFFTTANFSLIS